MVYSFKEYFLVHIFVMILLSKFTFYFLLRWKSILRHLYIFDYCTENSFNNKLQYLINHL